MKRYKHYSLSALLLIASGTETQAQSSAHDRQIEELDQAFVTESLALMPSAATGMGYHQHHGVALDEQLDDYSPAGVQAALNLAHRYLNRVEQMKQADLTTEQRADLQLIRLQCQSQLLDFEQIQSYRHNPTMYVEAIGNAVYQPSVLEYAPEAQRLAQIIARVEKIPAALAMAKKNLVSAPGIWVKVAEEENEGDIDLIDHQIRAKIPPSLKPRYDKAASAALAALRDFSIFLKNDLSKHPADWQLGTSLYAAKFKLTLATGDTPERTLQDAEAKLGSIREDMRKQAIAVFPKYFPGQTPPADLNECVSKVLNKIAQVHTTPDNYLNEAKRDLAAARQFVKDRHFLQLPTADNLQVIPTPEFMRGIYGVGGFAAAPALEPQLGAFYWVTPFTRDMTPARVESKLREYNRWGLEILTIHEAMPGHYVQFEYASEVQPKWRGILREVFSNGPYVEGWAVYATQFMIEGGFDDTPEMRLTFGKQMLRVVSNTVLDIRLQTMGMTDAQAMNLMISQTFQEKEEAEKKLQRAKLSSCQLPTYFVGWRGWDLLRDQYEKKSGGSFSLPAFHQRALKEGAVPLPVLSSLLLQ